MSVRRTFQKKKQNARLIEARLHFALVIVIIVGLRSDMGLASAGTYWVGACSGRTAQLGRHVAPRGSEPRREHQDADRGAQAHRIPCHAGTRQGALEHQVQVDLPQAHGARQVRVARRCRCALARYVGCPVGKSGGAGHAARLRGRNFRGC